MSFTISKTISTDFTSLVNPLPESGELRSDINAAIGSAVLGAVLCSLDTDNCDLVFDVEPSAGDKTTIDSTVVAHVGTALSRGLPFAQLSSSVDQIPSDTNPVAIKFNTQDAIQRLIHQTTGPSGVIEIKFRGSYFVMAQPQVGKDSGAVALDFNMFLQVNRGSGFSDEPNSNIKLTIKDADRTDVIVSGFTIQLDAGDKIRMMQQVSAVGSGIGLKVTAAVVGPPTIPATPSVILTIFRSGRF